MIEGEFFVDGGESDAEILSRGRVTRGQFAAQRLDAVSRVVNIHGDLSRADQVAQRGEEEDCDSHGFLRRNS